ncbi:HypC/HybG/HupF family hydrogenase formation chaperone [Micromonospora aurantiaca]|nr:HypC/HybG/HupF family hydrogenase formation chaperone [Micromonospora aurantiaca]
MTSRGWRLGDREAGGVRREISLFTSDDRHVMVQLDPGISVIDPQEHPDQTITRVILMTARYSGRAHPFGALPPITTSELLTDLTHLTA